MSLRNVIMLSPKNQMPANIIQQIDAAGWKVLAASSIVDLEVLFGQQDYRVGLVCLDELDDTELVKMEEFVLANRFVEWIALVSLETLRSPRACKFIKELCYDFHSKPVEVERLLFALGHLYGKAELAGHPRDHEHSAGYQGMIGNSPEMRMFYSKLDKIHSINEPVLITGESGTGKELVARAIHQLSVRRAKPFIAINCATLSSNLRQSEVFGYEQGESSGESRPGIGLHEAAAGGTLFLDEIADFPMQSQMSLLDFLQDKTAVRPGSDRKPAVDVRVIAATKKSLEEAVARGQFREDLYYRINVLQLSVPPLREREGDIELLAQEYFKRFASETKHTAQGFGAQALQVMKRYHWPGNVRELISRVKHAMIMSQSRLLVPADLGVEVRASPRRTVTLTKARIKAEQKLIQCALGRNRNNVSEAARELGVSRATMYRLMSKLNQA